MFIYRYHKHLPMQTYMGLKLYCFLCIFLLTFVHVSLEGKLSIQYAFTSKGATCKKERQETSDWFLTADFLPEM